MYNFRHKKCLFHTFFFMYSTIYLYPQVIVQFSFWCTAKKKFILSQYYIRYDKVGVGVDNFLFLIIKILKFENEKRFPGKTPYTPP